MHYAKNKAGELIYASHLTPQEAYADVYYCPRCQKEVLWVKRSGARPYFRHGVESKVDPRESAWHQKSKASICGALRETGYLAACEVVVGAGAGERRADVYVPMEEGYLAIELQYSYLAWPDVRKREGDHQKAGGAVLWLLAQKASPLAYKSQRLNRLAPFLSYQPEIGFFLPYYEAAARRVELWQLDPFGAVEKRLALSLSNYLHYFSAKQKGQACRLTWPVTHRAPIKPPVPALTRQARERLLLRLRLRPNQAENRLLKHCYEASYPLQQFPTPLLLEKRALLLYEEPLWVALAYVLLLKEQGEKAPSSLATYLTPRPGLLCPPSQQKACLNALWTYEN